MCMIETVTYPSWWTGATTVRVVTTESGVYYDADRENVEFLPQGVSTTDRLIPWSAVKDVHQTS